MNLENRIETHYTYIDNQRVYLTKEEMLEVEKTNQINLENNNYFGIRVIYKINWNKQ